MTEDAVVVLANGVMDRDTVVAALGRARPWRRNDIGDTRLVRTGPDTAAQVHCRTAYRDADEPAFIALMFSLSIVFRACVSVL